ncbi:YbaB/EbfC family nucleoid-associated protein [Candidatus Acidulodesulfobacterium sp. H_13]|uniref:YbaB/EbfC family nucleoid-associated protein n=1 Tax=Candidatus Acidulodesulfobacterium sp. H_13 TaxID=3395470 RepID=UPI003AF96F9A
MPKNMAGMLKQAQRLQSDMLKMQEELGSKIVESSSGGGMVTARVNGKQELIEIKIDKAVVDPEDIEMLQDLIVASINEVLTKSKDMVSGEMSKLTGGLNLPGMF